MDFRRYEITEDDAGRRVDRVVRRFMPGISLSAVYKLLRKGLIRVDGKRVAPDFRAEAGNELMISSAIGDFRDEEAAKPVSPVAGMPETLCETEDLLFINKPVGVSVHGDGGLDSLMPASPREDRSLSFRTGPLHRLDRDTSGVMAFSRSLAGARWFSSGIRDRAFRKEYLGIARGRLDADAEWRDADAEGREMATLAYPLAWSSDGAFTLVRYRILTGRKHQIRIQTAGHGHPLAGDRLYDRDPLACSPGWRTYFLHAWRLSFGEGRLPGVPETVRAPLPPAFSSAVATLFGDGALSLTENE